MAALLQNFSGMRYFAGKIESLIKLVLRVGNISVFSNYRDIHP